MINSRFRRNVYDGSLPLFQHRAYRCTRQRITRAQIQRQHLVEDFGLQFPQRHAARVTANCIYKRVQPAVFRKNLFDQLTHRRLIRDINTVPFEL